jgi:hypothetical protein
MIDACAIFRARWLGWLIREAETFRSALPALLSDLRRASPLEALWMARSLAETLRGATTIVPEVIANDAAAELASLGGPSNLRTAA